MKIRDLMSTAVPRERDDVQRGLKGGYLARTSGFDTICQRSVLSHPRFRGAVDSILRKPTHLLKNLGLNIIVIDSFIRLQRQDS